MTSDPAVTLTRPS